MAKVNFYGLSTSNNTVDTVDSSVATILTPFESIDGKYGLSNIPPGQFHSVYSVTNDSMSWRIANNISNLGYNLLAYKYRPWRTKISKTVFSKIIDGKYQVEISPIRNRKYGFHKISFIHDGFYKISDYQRYNDKIFRNKSPIGKYIKIDFIAYELTNKNQYIKLGDKYVSISEYKDYLIENNIISDPNKYKDKFYYVWNGDTWNNFGNKEFTLSNSSNQSIIPTPTSTGYRFMYKNDNYPVFSLVQNNYYIWNGSSWIDFGEYEVKRFSTKLAKNTGDWIKVNELTTTGHYVGEIALFKDNYYYIWNGSVWIKFGNNLSKINLQLKGNANHLGNPGSNKIGYCLKYVGENITFYNDNYYIWSGYRWVNFGKNTVTKTDKGKTSVLVNSDSTKIGDTYLFEDGSPIGEYIKLDNEFTDLVIWNQGQPDQYDEESELLENIPSSIDCNNFKYPGSFNFYTLKSFLEANNVYLTNSGHRTHILRSKYKFKVEIGNDELSSDYSTLRLFNKNVVLGCESSWNPDENEAYITSVSDNKITANTDMDRTLTWELSEELLNYKPFVAVGNTVTRKSVIFSEMNYSNPRLNKEYIRQTKYIDKNIDPQTFSFDVTEIRAKSWEVGVATYVTKSKIILRNELDVIIIDNKYPDMYIPNIKVGDKVEEGTVLYISDYNYLLNHNKLNTLTYAEKVKLPEEYKEGTYFIMSMPTGSVPGIDGGYVLKCFVFSNVINHYKVTYNKDRTTYVSNPAFPKFENKGNWGSSVTDSVNNIGDYYLTNINVTINGSTYKDFYIFDGIDFKLASNYSIRVKDKNETELILNLVVYLHSKDLYTLFDIEESPLVKAYMNNENHIIYYPEVYERTNISKNYLPYVARNRIGFIPLNKIVDDTSIELSMSDLDKAMNHLFTSHGFKVEDVRDRTLYVTHYDVFLMVNISDSLEFDIWDEGNKDIKCYLYDNYKVLDFVSRLPNNSDNINIKIKRNYYDFEYPNVGYDLIITKSNSGENLTETFKFDLSDGPNSINKVSSSLVNIKYYPQKYPYKIENSNRYIVDDSGVYIRFDKSRYDNLEDFNYVRYLGDANEYLNNSETYLKLDDYVRYTDETLTIPSKTGSYINLRDVVISDCEFNLNCLYPCVLTDEMKICDMLLMEASKYEYEVAVDGGELDARFHDAMYNKLKDHSNLLFFNIFNPDDYSFNFIEEYNKYQNVCMSYPTIYKNGYEYPLYTEWFKLAIRGDYTGELYNVYIPDYKDVNYSDYIMGVYYNNYKYCLSHNYINNEYIDKGFPEAVLFMSLIRNRIYNKVDYQADLSSIRNQINTLMDSINMYINDGSSQVYLIDIIRINDRTLALVVNIIINVFRSDPINLSIKLNIET